MCCTCGHHHHHDFKQEKMDKAIRDFISNFNGEINFDEEYQKIQNKTSKLSRSQRDTIKAIVEYKKEINQE